MPDEKMKYPLLEFEYDKKLYEELLTLNPHPGFMDRVSIVTEDYEHDDFGRLPGDDKNALGHAAGVLLKLHKHWLSPSEERDRPVRTKKGSRTKWSSLLSFLADLENDFQNYCACLKHGMGNKADLYALTETLLYYGCEDTVWEEVTEWNDAVKEDKNSSKSTFFNFDRLYIRQADRFLFLDNNTEEALKFYALAALPWRTGPSEAPAEKNIDDYSVSFIRQYELYDHISRGVRYPYGTSSQSSAFYQQYNRIIHTEISSSSLSRNLSSFVSSIQEVLDAPTLRKLHRARLALLMFFVITKRHLIPELARLYDDPDKERWEVEITEKSLLLKGTNYSILSRYAAHMTWKSGKRYFDSYLGLAKAAHLSELLLDELNAEDDNEEIAYYTSADVFSYMLPEKCKEEDKKDDRLGKLTVMHLSYMNDPNEGKTLQKAIYGPSYGALQKGRKPLDVPFVFVKCFSPRIDYLPMWEMYGDHARGCCLVIDWEMSKWMEDESEPILYRVCYLRKQGNSYIVLKEDNEKLSKSCRTINSQLQELHKVAEGIAEEDRHYLDDVLGKVLYLFKDSSYSYEQELRVIYQTKENILHTEPKNPEDKPWLFVQTPFPLQLDEVILGPKFPDVSTRVPYLQEQIDQMCEKTDTEMPRITLSEIDYR